MKDLNTSVNQLIEQDSAIQPVIDRREFVKGGVASTAAVSLAALASTNGAFAAVSDYGPVSPKTDNATGLNLISLPDGFEYWSYGWRGQTMSDGQATPNGHDGMAVVAAKGNQIALVRNHELGTSGSSVVLPRATYDSTQRGGTTNILFDALNGSFLASFASLTGTIRNCAGGPTPWGTWITCEETNPGWNAAPGAKNHGYVFEVPGFGLGNPQPIRAAGRFSHEAVAIDPVTGYMYETEDAGSSAFYKFVPNGAWGNLHAGGTLYALVVAGQPSADLRGGFANGTTWDVEWVEVQDPEAINGNAFNSAPGAAIFERGEGCWYDGGVIYFVSTSGGAVSEGQIFAYDPREEKLTLVFESPNSLTMDGPDNLTVSPRGGLLLCEDGSRNPQRLIGLTQSGTAFVFAENTMVLSASDAATIQSVYPGSTVTAGSYGGQEWCGACFYNQWLFVNIQTPGVTFAIRGPWNKGAL